MTKTTDMAPVRAGYAAVNGLNMYYEVHGEGQPLVLLHGAFSAIGTSFQHVLPGLAKTRRVIGLEMQAHGHTADIDRALSPEQMADDTVAALGQLGVEKADFFGYSMGSDVALHIVVRHPDVVRKLVLASATYTLSGVHPGLMDGLAETTPEIMFGSPWHEEYLRIAPRPEDFTVLFEKKTQMDRELKDFSAEDISAIKSPTLLIIGDSDLVRPGTQSRCSAYSVVVSSATPPPAFQPRS
jgi:pimeloyl-ACP methyl ester carboxylesterase